MTIGLWRTATVVARRHGAPDAVALATLVRARAPHLRNPLILTGRVIWPRDPDYEEARQSFNARFSRFPAAIVVCDNTDDVRNAVRWARQEGIPLRARSGGHSYEAFSVVDGGLVIDVGGLNGSTSTWRAARRSSAPGCACSICYRRLWEHGVTIPAGTCPGVGIAGLTLGGGIGFLSRQYGLTCDNLLAVELVDADGDVLRASEERASRSLLGAARRWRRELRHRHRLHLPRAPDWRRGHLHGDLAVGRCGGGARRLAALGAVRRRAPLRCARRRPPERGSDLGDGTVHRFRGRAAAPAGTAAPRRHTGCAADPVPAVPHGRRAVCRTTDRAACRSRTHRRFAYDPLPAEAIATLVEHLRAAPFASNLVGFFPLGGAIATSRSGGNGVRPPPRALRSAIPGVLVGRRRCSGVHRLGSRPARGDGAVHDRRLRQLHRRRPPRLGEPRTTERTWRGSSG